MAVPLIQNWKVEPNDGVVFKSTLGDQVTIQFPENKGTELALIGSKDIEYTVTYDDGTCSATTKITVPYCMDNTPGGEIGGGDSEWKCPNGCVSVRVIIEQYEGLQNSYGLKARISKSDPSISEAPIGGGVRVITKINGIEQSSIQLNTDGQVHGSIDRNATIAYVGFIDSSNSIENNTTGIVSNVSLFCTAKVVNGVCYATQNSKYACDDGGGELLPNL